MEGIEKLHELALDINGTEIIAHIDLGSRLAFHSEWLDSWHKAFDAACDEIEREIAERYMALPLDVDGVPVHVGDMIQQINHAGVWTDAMRVVAVDENGCFALTHGLACEARTYVWGNNCRHVSKRTIEDVLQCAGVSVAAIEDVAAEIRELMGVDK